jgi:cyclophilin family peptidyl-prolyl cis-trans isomerase
MTQTVTCARRRFLQLLAALSLGAIAQSGLAAEANQVSLKTSMGEIVLELYPDQAPKTVANFLQYVRNGHYEGTIFHRVIDGFMIQGGGFVPNMGQKPTGKPIENEAKNGLKNTRYSISMARTNAPHSATAQFFINVKDNAALDYPGHDGWGYAVFGKVIKGQGVVDKIKGVSTASIGMHQNVPLAPIVIESASVIK